MLKAIKKHISTKNMILFIIFIFSLSVRLYFAFAFPNNPHQHDTPITLKTATSGHLGNIVYMHDHPFQFPVNYADWQNYHPPLHYIIGACYYFIADFLHTDPIVTITVFLIIQNVMLFFLARKLFDDEMLPIIIFMLYPMNVMVSQFLNNDGTFFFFACFSLYFMYKWEKNQSLKNTILMALFTMLATITKKNGYYIILTAFLLVIWKLCETIIKSKKEKIKFPWKLWCLMTISYIAIVAPLPIAVAIDKYKTYGQSFLYTPDMWFLTKLTKGFSFINPISIFKDPFLGTFSQYDLSTKAHSAFEYLFKSSMFGEWEFKVTVLTYFIIIANFIIWGWTFLNFFRLPKTYMLFFFVTIFSMIYFIHKLPYWQSAHFRYILPVLIPMAWTFKKENFVYWKNKFTRKKEPDFS